jgi:hypothetical protein
MKTFQTSGPLTLDLRNAAGSVRVDLVDTDTTSVDIELVAGGPLGFVDEIVRTFGGRHGDEERPPRWWEPPNGAEAQAVLDRVRVELTDRAGVTTLLVDTDPAARGWRTAFAVHVTAPAHSTVQLASQSADARITGTAAALRVRTASGDITAADVTGPTEMTTASGDVRVQAVGGELRCRTASGDVEVAAVGGPVVVHTVSGDARLGSPAGDVEVRTVSGDIRIADLTAGRAKLTAVSGAIDVGIHAGSLAAVNLTTISGSTRSDFDVREDGGPADVSPDASRPGGPDGPEGPDGSGGPEAPDARRAPQLDIRARTTSGDIRLRRSVSA